MKTGGWLSILVLAGLTLLGGAAPANAEIITSTRGGIVVGSRSAGTTPGSISVIDVATNQVTTISMPGGANTPDAMYIVHSLANNLVFVGDRANNRIVAFDAITFEQVPSATLTAGPGIFHMWGNQPQNQLWVVNDGNRSVSVLDMANFTTLQTISLPTNLPGTPHDVIVDSVARQAYVTVNGSATGQSTVIRFSTDTFLETGRVTSGDLSHVFLTEANNSLYVLSQDADRIDVFNRTTLLPVTSIPLQNAHGADATTDGQRIYASTFPRDGTVSDGNLLAAIDPASNMIIGSTIPPLDGAGPHNVAVALDNSQIYVTHTGSNVVSYYDIGPDGIPVLAGTLTIGGPNAFGITALVPVPEPGSWLLLLTGSLSVAGALWRRLRKV